jgi:hypothetical protein
VWNKTLARSAQAWADTCQFSHDGNVTDDNVGENMYAAWGVEDLSPSYVVKEAMKSWYYEYHDYDYKYPELSPDTGHFTQMIWKATISVGCGIRDDCDDNMRIVVCRYYPAGNDETSLRKNVPRPVPRRAARAA